MLNLPISGALVTFPFDAIDQKEVLYTATRAQIGNILLHPTDKTLLAVTEVPTMTCCKLKSTSYNTIFFRSITSLNCSSRTARS